MMNRRLRNELAVLLGIGAGLTALPSYFGQRKRPLNPWAVGLGLTSLALVLLPRRSFSYRGKSVVITGASRGLGLSLARQLVHEGAKVTLLARDPEELDAAKRELHHLSNEVFTAHCDVTKCEQLDVAFAEARARFGAIDVLINNAGVIAVGPFDTMTAEDFEAQFNVHLRGPIEATRLIRPYFHQQGEGRIINISSIGGRIAVPHMAAYSASKFALAGFSKAVREELKLENISVTTVYPGLMRTGSPMQAVFKGDQEKEFTWFAASDNTPILSISPERAARQILNAARDGQAEVFVSLPARLGAFVNDVFPEITSSVLGLAARLMPQGRSHQRRTGAASSRLFASLGGIGKIWRNINRNAAETHNQRPSFNAESNLGMEARAPLPQT